MTPQQAILRVCLQQRPALGWHRHLGALVVFALGLCAAATVLPADFLLFALILGASLFGHPAPTRLPVRSTNGPIPSKVQK